MKEFIHGMVCGIVGGLAAVATLTFLDKFFG
jgi:hypothetical protein